MLDGLQQLKKEVLEQLEKIKDSDQLRDLEVKYLGRKGELTNILRQLKDLSAEEKGRLGKLANEIKELVTGEIEQVRQRLTAGAAQSAIDTTLPGTKFPVEHLHPLTQVQERLEQLFVSLGFMITDGPEVESEYFNFEALNIPADHPARDMQDTFFIEEGSKGDPQNRLLLRTHTSSMQVRAMRQYGAPLRLVARGRVFRNESTDARHEHTFYQLEGLMVDQDITLAHLKAVLQLVAVQLYGEGTKVRLRPKFYPFVEPGVNGEVTCFLCRGQGCRVCKQTGWLEVFGAGLVHPTVLQAGGVDPKTHSAFAFGFGWDRLTMLQYNIDDVRLLQSGDRRFLDQF